MRRAYLICGCVFLAFAVLGVLAAWWEVWRLHRREVERVRLVWGLNAETPRFDPVALVDPSGMSAAVVANYMGALAFGAAGVLCLLLWHRRRRAERLAAPTQTRR